MAFPELKVCREFSAERINRVLNDPGVRPFVGLPEAGPLDFGPLVANPRNYLLMAQGGGFFLQCIDPGVYEIHTQFLPEARGRHVVEATVDMQRFMFGRTDCVEIVTKVPSGNVAATALVRKAAMQSLYRHDGTAFYTKTIFGWAETARVTRESSAFLPVSDDLRRTMLMLAIEMAAFGQIDKALRFYSRFSGLTNTLPLALVAVNPLVFDIGEALIALRGEELETVLCRQPCLSR
jgi:hypothetical protein